MKRLLIIGFLIFLSLPLMAGGGGESALYSQDIFRYGGVELPVQQGIGEFDSGLFYNYQANLYMFKMGIKRDLCKKVNLQLNYIMASRDYELFPGKRSMEFVQIGARFRLLKNK